MKIVFISWASECSRSDTLAAELGGHSLMIYSPRWGSRFITAPFKYLSQSIKTLAALFRLKPSVVFVMTPPVIACVPVWLYVVLTRGKMIIDAHTGAFLLPLWKRLLFLHRFFSRRAAATLITNGFLKSIVESWSAVWLLVPDVPAVLSHFGRTELPEGINLLFVSSFTDDEPLGAFIEAARRIPDVNFHVSGDFRACPREILDNRPPNVFFTGFLPREEYGRYVNTCAAVICLTTLDHTMQRGAYEAIYSGRPVITSDFPVLREAFPLGTVFVKSEIEDLVRGITEFRENRKRLSEEALELRERKSASWKETLARVSQLASSENCGR